MRLARFKMAMVGPGDGQEQSPGGTFDDVALPPPVLETETWRAAWDRLLARHGEVGLRAVFESIEVSKRRGALFTVDPDSSIMRLLDGVKVRTPDEFTAEMKVEAAGKEAAAHGSGGGGP